MQLSGIRVDSKRYVEMIEQALGSNTDPPMPSNKVVSLERFKFWLGMPNDYYNSDD